MFDRGKTEMVQYFLGPLCIFLINISSCLVTDPWYYGAVLK